MFRLRFSSRSHKAVYAPRTKEELIDNIREEVKNQGTDSPDLNYIDTFYIKNMDGLFSNAGILGQDNYGFGKLNPDISDWDVSNVTSAYQMFNANKSFKGDLSRWKFHKLEIAKEMFMNSSFNGDISGWCSFTASLRIADWMFAFSKFDGDISKWNLGNCTDLTMMFLHCPCTHTNPSLWTLPKKCRTYKIFSDSPMEEKYGVNGEKIKRK